MVNRAPYKHQDGSNCWTRNCSRGHRKNGVLTGKPVTRIPEKPVNDEFIYSTQAEETDFMNKLRQVMEEPHSTVTKISFTKTQPLHIVSAAGLKEKFATTLKTEFDVQKIQPVQETDYSLEKPTGGLWAAPFNEEGSDDWNEFYEPQGQRYEVNMKPTATIAVIDSAEDYVALMQRFKHTEETFAATGKQESLHSTSGGSVWRTETERLDSLNYRRLGQIVDAVYVTRKGIRECTVWSSKDTNNTLPENMATLHSWDVSSLLVFNPKILTLTPTATPPRKDAYDEPDWSEYDWYNEKPA